MWKSLLKLLQYLRLHYYCSVFFSHSLYSALLKVPSFCSDFLDYVDESDIINKILKLSKAAPLVEMLAGRSEELTEQELGGESSP